MFYLETNSLNPYYNLAFEEYVLKNCCDKAYFILWQNDNTIVIGRNQNAQDEINKSFVERSHVKVVRRITGGGAVYHDLGNINYSIIVNYENDQFSFQNAVQPIVNALRKLGLPAEVSGRNDILVNGKKVSGTASAKFGNRILYHGTLLFNSNLSRVEQALHVEPGKYLSKGIKSVRSRVDNIQNYLVDTCITDIMSFLQYLKSEILGEHVWYGKLSYEDLQSIRQLQRTKYESWEWNYGKSPSYTFANKRKWEGGYIEVKILVRSNIIENVQIYGDFMATMPLEEIKESLQGCPYKRTAVENVLERYNLKYYFGGITKEEILNTFFEIPQGC